jgi:pyruvate dehydrogenase E1 component alpha subunit
MVAHPIRLPDLGAASDEAYFVGWLVAEGDTVARGDLIAEVETDKAIMQMECPYDGTVLRLLAAPEDVLVTGDVLAWVGEPGEAVPEVEAEARAREPSAERPARAVAQIASAVAGRIPPAGLATEPVAGRADRVGDAAFLLRLYRQMVLIRRFEERVKYLFLEGVMPGTIHQYQGQEAIAVGVCEALGPDDVITSTHRPHGHALAKGIPAEALMHELFGKATGCCRGKGGSMHVGDLAHGMVPAIAIVGGGVPVATGVALAFRMRREPRVAVCFMGDGAVNEGAFHEGVNIGAIWSLPVVYVIENNLYSASTPICQTTRLARLSDRAAGYGIPGVTVDGNDVLGVYEVASEAVERARAGGGPTLVELLTYRITGHSRRDPCLYQPEEERRQAAEREPIGRFAARLTADGVATQEALEAIGADVDAEIEAAVRSAMAAPDPAPEDALEGLWA